MCRTCIYAVTVPLPRAIARLNKRYTNRFIEPVVRRLSGFAVVEHVGRVSGKRYRTPVFLFSSGDSFVVALTYGPSADWAQNVLAGGATLHRERGGSQRGEQPETIVAASIVARGAAWKHLPIQTRLVLRLLRVHDFLELAVSSS